ncbi:MAG: hypothetical protein AMXMBFR64_17300 [Myxococcales bacterium]
MYLVYLVIMRSFLWVTTAFIVVYFAGNTSWVRELVVEVVAAEIPGRIDMDGIQWGPLPWQARVVGVRITEPGGQAVITADAVYGEIELLPFLRWVTRSVAAGGLPFELSITGADVRDYTVVLDMREQADPLLVYAFDDMKPSEGPSRPARVVIRGGHGSRGVVTILLPGLEQRYEGVDFRGAELDIGPPEGLRIHSPALVLQGGTARFDAELNPVADRPWEVRVGRGVVDEWVWDKADEGFRVRSVDLELDRGHLVVQGAMGFPGGAVRYDATARLDLEDPEGRHPMLTALLDGALRGPLSVWARGAGTFDEVWAEVQLASPALDIAGLATTGVRVDGSITPGARGPVVQVGSAEASVAGGHVLLDDARLDTGALLAEGTVRLAGVSPWELVTSAPLALDPDGLDLLRARLSGGLRVRAAFGGPLDVTAEILDRPMTVAFEALPEGLPLGERPTIEGELGVGVGHGVTLRATRVVVRSGDDVARIDGSLAIPGLVADGTVDLSIPDLQAFLRPFDVEGVRGDLTIAGARVSGPLVAPEVTGADVVARNVRIGELAFGRLQGQAALRGGVVSVIGLKAATDLGGVSLDGTVRIHDGDLTRPNSTLPFTVERLRAEKIPLGRLLEGRSGAVTLTGVKASGVLSDPLGSLTASGRVLATDVGSAVQPVERLEGQVRVDKGRVSASDVTVVLPGGERVLGDDLAWDPATGALRASVRTDRVTLERLAALRGIPLGGVVSGHLRVEGRSGAFQVGGDVDVRGFRYDTLDLGDASLTLSTDAAGAVRLAASRFFHGWTLEGDSSVTLRRDGVPTFLVASVRFADQDLFDLFPSARLPWLRNRLSGKAQLALDLREGGFGLDFSFGDGGIRAAVDTLGQTLSVSNKGDAYAMLTESGDVWIQELQLDTPHGPLEACGTFSAEGGQDLWVRGAARLEVLEAWKDAFSVLEGRVVTAGDPEVVARWGRGCLPAEATHPGLGGIADLGSIHLMGPLDRLAMEGTLRLDEGRARLRSLASEVVLDPGVRVELRTAREREERVGERSVTVADQVLRTPADGPIGATYDEGRIDVGGRMRLLGWAPDSLDLTIRGVDIDYASPQEYRVKVTPQVTFEGRALSGEKPRMKLGGDVAIVEGSYHAGSTLGAALIRGATGARKLVAYSKSLVESAPWLGPMGLGIRLQGESFALRMKLPFGETDMELRLDVVVRGTLAEPEVFGHIDVLPGGRIGKTIFGRDFEVTKAGFDLAGRPSRFQVDAELRTEVTFREERGSDSLRGKAELASVSSGSLPEEKTVVVRTRVKGVVDMEDKGRELAGVELTLDSDSGGYDRAELMFLLVTGAPSRSKLDESESTATINVLTGELADVLAKTLLGAFVDAVSLGVTVTGGFDWSLEKSLGRNLKFSVRGVQDDTVQRVQPNFRFQITDELSLEGSLRFEQGTAARAGQAYETKLRYRIPLD